MTEEVQRRLEYLDLQELRFDPNNPRLPQGRSSARDEVLRYLLESANLIDLMRSIGTQDFFPGEPLLVTDKENGSYTVVEGNRRYAACWLLSNPDAAPVRGRAVAAVAAEAQFRPQRLPCLVLPQQEIVGFLGYRHITGIQEWSPLAKARYLLMLWNDDEGPELWRERLQWIARRIGSKSDYVARLLTALALFDQIEQHAFYDIPGLNEETLSFSLLALAMNRPAIAMYIGLEDGQDFELEGLDNAKLNNVAHWFFERDNVGRTVLGESRNVSDLVAVLQHEEARVALEHGASLRRAFRLTEAPSLALTENLNQALEALDAAVALMASETPDPSEHDIALAAAVLACAQEVVSQVEQHS
jgi:hypothetical protein